MQRKHFGLALVDLLAVAALSAVLLAIGVPTLSRARELSQRMTCSVNLAGIGASGAAYAAANKGSWMIPAFHRAKIDNGGIDYLAGSMISPIGSEQPGEVGFDRNRESKSETPYAPSAGSDAISVTRAYWMLVRSGDITVKQFICPSSLNDVPDPTENVDLYYDFTQYWNISYGYLVPFGPRDTQPREGMDNRQVLAADKGIFYTTVYWPSWFSADGTPLTLESPPGDWRPYNSINNGGFWYGEGQNALYADGHASFLRTPLGGMDSDNIYTLMTDEWSTLPYNRIHGDTPHQFWYNPYPGQGAFGSGVGRYSTTDSLIYP
jgi:prepilin-type processing-associated H-X9-DG protein